MIGFGPKKTGKAAVWRAAFLAATVAVAGAARAADQEYGYEYKRLLSGSASTPETGMDSSELGQVQPRDLKNPSLAQVKWYVDHNQFRKALAAFLDAAKSMKKDKPLRELRDRLELSARSYPELSPVEPWEVNLSSSLRYFCYGNDRSSMLHASYALDINHQDMVLDNYVSNLEKATHHKAERIEPDAPRHLIGELLHRAEGANSQGNYNQVRFLLNDIIELEPANLTALERLGSVDFELARYQDAIDVWERAVKLENTPSEAAALRQYLKKARGKLTQALPLPGGGINPGTPRSQ